MQNIVSPDMLPTVLWGGAGLIAILAVALVALLVRGSRMRMDLAMRMEQMIAHQNAMQQALNQRMVDTERTVSEQMSNISRRVGESLQTSTEKTGETLAALRERLAVIDSAQKNITELSTQVVGLQDILSNKQARGAFGEVQLHDLVEGVLPASAYSFQATVGGNRRVDCLIDLPNPPGPIAIDAKFPLEGYHALRKAQSETELQQAQREFRRALLQHVSDIKDKYIVPGETAEAALMFLPSEAVYAELHANFPDVVEKSFKHRVYIVAPTTLWATLNTVRAIFRDVRMREQAGLIQKLCGTMIEDVGRLEDRVSNLQRHFDQANEDVRQIRISSDKVAGHAAKIREAELEDDSAESPSIAPVQRAAGQA